MIYPTECRVPGSSVHGIPQARTLECIAIFFSDLPDPGIKPRSPALQADSLPLELQGILICMYVYIKYSNIILYMYNIDLLDPINSSMT